MGLIWAVNIMQRNVGLQTIQQKLQPNTTLAPKYDSVLQREMQRNVNSNAFNLNVLSVFWYAFLSLSSDFWFAFLIFGL